MRTYVTAFSLGVTEVLEAYGFDEKIMRLGKAELLYTFVSKFADLDLSEKAVSNREIGMMFEELLRRFSEMSNETAGEHFTPREVIRLLVNILLSEDDRALSGQVVCRVAAHNPAGDSHGNHTVYSGCAPSSI
ncbi:MAG: N-6 DNA methylase [Candidatus Nanopelagicales bacterium]|nr:N-6 DNA methylase [Candidatus Nanopelagicales bacterium]